MDEIRHTHENILVGKLELLCRDSRISCIPLDEGEIRKKVEEFIRENGQKVKKFQGIKEKLISITQGALCQTEQEIYDELSKAKSQRHFSTRLGKKALFLRVLENVYNFMINDDEVLYCAAEISEENQSVQKTSFGPVLPELFTLADHLCLDYISLIEQGKQYS